MDDYEHLRESDRKPLHISAIIDRLLVAELEILTRDHFADKPDADCAQCANAARIKRWLDSPSTRNVEDYASHR